MTFRRVNDFSTDKPVMLDRELSQLESNVADEFAVASKTYAREAAVSDFAPLGASIVVPLLPGEQRSIDTSLLSALAVLPPLRPDNFGKRFVVIKRAAANGITVSCADPKVLHNGGAFPVLGVGFVGVRIFYCDAAGYYS